MPRRDDVAGVRAALGDGRGQRGLQRAVQPVGILGLQVIHRRRRRDLGLPQRLVGQQVAYPGDLGLI
jgi:hypothetical protein